MSRTKSENSQVRVILRHLIKYGSITSWESIRKYGATRLAAIIKILRNEGYDIITIMHYENGKKWAEYTLDVA